MEDIIAKVTRTDSDKDFLAQVKKWQSQGEEGMKLKWSKWQDSIKQVKGEFPLDEQSRSKVRNRSKIFWRKTWAIIWRILATMYQIFLKEDSLKIEGRMGNDDDVVRGKLLTEMVKYRRDIMNKEGDLFIKFVWSILDILQLGTAVIKLRWVYDSVNDGPEAISYAPENVFPDPYATTQRDMRYIIFETFLSKDELEEQGYENLDQIKAETKSGNVVTNAREGMRSNIIKPPLSVDSNYYPKDGSGEALGFMPSSSGGRYRVWEVLWKKDGLIWYAVTNAGHTILKYPAQTSLEIYPCVIGSCLIEPHSFLGEGFPEPMAGPQASANATLNMRKDAVALALTPRYVVSRYAGVDLQSLVNAKVGGVIVANDVNGVVPERTTDVTQKAYIEADADDFMMQEMSGVTAQREGLISNPGEKATVANIRYQESGTKLDLYAGIIAETFFKKFYTLLAYMIQKFETNETVFRVANAALRNENPEHKETWTIDSFQADYIVQVGTDVLGKQQQINQAMMAMDRATASNAAIFQLIQVGALPKEKAIIFNTTRFMLDLLPLIGFKNIKDYIVEVQQPPMPVAGVPGIASAPKQPTMETGVMGG